MVPSKTADSTPRWLQPIWERKKLETVRRVRAAADHLAATGTPVTLVAVRDAVKELFQASISTNTIQRNDQAYEIYLEHAKGPRRPSGGYGLLVSSVRESKGRDRAALRARIARLRRESKDALIFRLFQLEAREREQSMREEVLRLSLRAPKKGAT